jgi:hypothetical protein
VPAPEKCLRRYHCLCHGSVSQVFEDSWDSRAQGRGKGRQQKGTLADAFLFRAPVTAQPCLPPLSSASGLRARPAPIPHRRVLPVWLSSWPAGRWQHVRVACWASQPLACLEPGWPGCCLAALPALACWLPGWPAGWLILTITQNPLFLHV